MKWKKLCLWGKNETILLFYPKNLCTSFCLIKFYDLGCWKPFEDHLKSQVCFSFSAVFKTLSANQNNHVFAEWFAFKPDW